MLHGRKLFSLLVVGVLLTLAVPAAQGGDLLSAQQDFVHGLPRLTGSWQGTTELGTTFLLSFHADKTYTVTFNLPGTGAAHGHGAWDRSGLRTFDHTDVSLVFDSNNDLVLLQKTQGEATVDGDEADFQLQVTLLLPDGTPVDVIPVVARAVRIEVEPVP